MTKALTWGYMKSWAEQNKVPDEAEMTNRDTGEPFADLGTDGAYRDEPAQFWLSEEYG